MTYAHAQGVVHRDIKPANVMLSRTADGWLPKVTDFGIAKVLSDSRRTETGTAMGTVYYASPEQLTDAKSVDHRADVYSLACTFYEMLTLRLPFEDGTMFGVMRKHVQAPRPDPSHANPEIPRDIANMVMRGMAVEAGHRFQSCAEFASELRSALGLPAVATASGAVPFSIDDVPRSSASEMAAKTPMTDSGMRPVLQRQSGLDRLPADSRPRVTQPGLARSTPSRSTRARHTSPDVTRPPVRGNNSVAKVMWVVIGLLAIAMLATVAFGGNGDPVDDDADDRDVSVAAVVVPDISAPPPEPDVAPDAAANNVTVQECHSLATRYLGFDPLGDVSIGDAISDLDEHIDLCADVLDRGAAGAFEETVAFLTVAQMRTILHDLLARRMHGLHEGDHCREVLTGVTEAHRGLRRIESAATRGELHAYEVDSLAPFRLELSRLYAHQVGDFSDCPIAEIPLELLAPGVVPQRPEPKPSDGSAAGAPQGRDTPEDNDARAVTTHARR